MPLKPETAHLIKTLTSHFAAVILAAALVAAVLLRTPLSADLFGVSVSVGDCEIVDSSEVYIDGERIDGQMCIFGSVEDLEDEPEVEDEAPEDEPINDEPSEGAE